MPWTIELDDTSGILLSSLGGVFTPEELHQHAAETIQAVLKYNYRKALIDLRNMEGGVNLSDIYDLPLTYEKKGLPRNVKIAILAEFGLVREDDLKFLMDRGKNMGYIIKVFQDEFSARQWLEESSGTRMKL